MTVAAAALAIGGLAAPTFAEGAHHDRVADSNDGSAGNCQDVDTTVPGSVPASQIAPLPPIPPVTDGPPLNIHRKLCLPEGGAPKTVMPALHGITYTNSYWNAEPPVDNADDYNFSSAMTEGGYAVYSIDRLGYGYRATCAATTGQNIPDDTPQFGAK